MQTQLQFIAAVRTALWEKYGALMSEEDEELAACTFLASTESAEETARGIAADIHGITEP
jgi:hypothetical protein